MSDEISSREEQESKYKILEYIAKIFSLAVVPFLLLSLNFIIFFKRQDQDMSVEYVKMAISVLQSCEAQDATMKEWAKRVLVEHSVVQF